MNIPCIFVEFPRALLNNTQRMFGALSAGVWTVVSAGASALRYEIQSSLAYNVCTVVRQIAVMATATTLNREQESATGKAAGPCVMVIFGAAGDLTKRK